MHCTNAHTHSTDTSMSNMVRGSDVSAADVSKGDSDELMAKAAPRPLSLPKAGYDMQLALKKLLKRCGAVECVHKNQGASEAVFTSDR